MAFYCFLCGLFLVFVLILVLYILIYKTLLKILLLLFYCDFVVQLQILENEFLMEHNFSSFVIYTIIVLSLQINWREYDVFCSLQFG